MLLRSHFYLATTFALLAVLPIEAQSRTEAEADTREALQAFIDAWNTGDNVELRKAMNFPFVSLFGSRVIAAEVAEDFSTDFEGMRQRNDWVRSDFDFDRFEVLESSAEKVHCGIDFRRYNSQGEAYTHGRVMYIVTRQDSHWGLQLRTGFVDPGLGEEDRAKALEGARQAVLDFFTAFNAGDADATTTLLNYPHVFLAGGGVRFAEDSTKGSVRPDFGRMRESQRWHMSTIDSLEASYVSSNKVHMELVFSRWHPDGTRYLTIPALWIVTRDGDHWGIQVRSLMPATFSSLASSGNAE